MSSSSRIPPESYVIEQFGSYYTALPGSPNQEYIPANTDCATLLQNLFDNLAARPNPTPTPPGGLPTGPQFKVQFKEGNFYFSKPVTINMPGGSAGGGLAIWGAGRNRTNLILNNGVNDDMFKITNVGNIFEVAFLKIHGNRGNQTGTSNGINFAGSGGELNFYHLEMRDCLTDCLKMAGANVAWNIFEDVWMLDSGKGIELTATYSDLRVSNSKFESIVAIQFEAGNTARFNLSGSILKTANILMNTGSTFDVNMTGNTLDTIPNNAIQWTGTGLGSLTDQRSLIACNTVRTATATNVAVYLGNRIDGVSIKDNEFIGFTPSSTVPITLIQTTQKLNTFILDNRGYNPQAWTTTTPTFPATGVDQQNLNPYPVLVYISGTGSGITAYGITSPIGTLQSFTTTVAVGNYYQIDPYGKVRFTYTGSPTWIWYGL